MKLLLTSLLTWTILGLLPLCLLDRSAISAEPDSAYVWNLPKGFPKPYVPPDNPMTPAKVELDRHLFYDTRMSVNGKASCATCHKQELAFTDGRAVGLGATGELHSRSAMSLVNVAYSAVLTWSNPRMKSLEEQALTPMFGEHPIELGLRQGDGFLPMLRSDPKYRVLFESAFPGDADRFTIGNVTKAIASFERSVISARSPYDRYHYDRDDNAISDSAKHGEILFFDQRLSCFRCHGGFTIGDVTVSERDMEHKTEERHFEFRNTGLYNVPGLLSYPAPNVGIYEYTKAPEDVGKFKAPTLRNIALTAPYMHDGSIPTLEGVLDHYSAGGRRITSGPHARNGHDNQGPAYRRFHAVSAGSRRFDRVPQIIYRRSRHSRSAVLRSVAAEALNFCFVRLRMLRSIGRIDPRAEAGASPGLRCRSLS